MGMRSPFRIFALSASLVTLVVLGQWSGLAAYEKYRGYLAPVWSTDGRFLYFMERESAGIVLGFGYDYFPPLANVYLTQDDLALRRLDLEDLTTQTLTRIQLTPKTRRWLEFNRGGIFGNVRAGLFEDDGSLNYQVRFEYGLFPDKEVWYSEGNWPGDDEDEGVPVWKSFPAPFIFANDQVLQGGRELLLAKGVENFGSAILAVDEDGIIAPLVTSPAYQHREGFLPPLMGASRRERIEAARDEKAFEQNLLAEFEAEGLSEGAAQQRYTLELERRGLRVPTRRLVAEEIAAPVDGDKVFPLSAKRFLPHTYPDLRVAISNPGLLVEAELRDRVRYGTNGELPGPKDWIEAGNRSFVIDTDQGLFRIMIVEPVQVARSDLSEP
jgi:hypothetical protein